MINQKNYDGRHEVSNKVLENNKKVMYAQDDFGIEKYNKPLHHSYKYDWLAMAGEELADFQKYLQCEADRKEEIIRILLQALESDNTKNYYIGEALSLLRISGTGK